MKITHIAAATLVPATIAGIALSVMPFAQASPARAVHPKARAAVHAKAHPVAHAAARHATRPAGNANVWVTVRPGETLSSIAATHHMPWQAIYATPPNPRILHGSTTLTVGERLRIPADPKLRAAQFQVKYAAQLQRQSAASAQAAQPSNASQGSITAGMSAFEQCVAWRESSNTPTDPDGLFGILPSTWASLGYSGTAGQASVALQKIAFNRLYAEYGTQPWAPSDGC